MNVVEIDRALRRLRLSRSAGRPRDPHARRFFAERLPHPRLLSSLVGDELLRRHGIA